VHRLASDSQDKATLHHSPYKRDPAVPEDLRPAGASTGNMPTASSASEILVAPYRTGTRPHGAIERPALQSRVQTALEPCLNKEMTR
jgi:hypothetical protein